MEGSTSAQDAWPASSSTLVDEDRVHRAAYVDPAVYARELRTFWAHTWQYVAHASQVPDPGDVVTVDLAGRPLMVARQEDGSLRVLVNRCAHKGTRLVDGERGHVGRHFRCPYHAWTYRLDGAPLGMPLREGYAGTRLASCASGRGLTQVKHVGVHRDFVFVKLGDAGPGFHDYFGDALAALDNLADRSPVGRLEVAGGVLRTIVRANWKIYLENVNDTVHPMATHESAVAAAHRVWKNQPAEAAKPMAMEQILPFGAPYEFFDRMGARIYANGHSLLGTRHSIHSGYGRLPEYEAAMRAAYGEARAREILEHAPQNAVLYPSLAVKGSPQAMRVIRPLAVDRTLVEAWSFRAVGAPDVMLERTQTYNRLVFSPMSIVAHDDLHLFESIQQGLGGEGNEWISLHRGHRDGERAEAVQDVSGTNEILMRNQFRAWAAFMALEPAEASA
ncbi:MAG TPA: aromatic ring-hydroxylating dioxygenase subunit alpha [Caldimonas sp.]|nr:aromatic ring-hydroxylating dioxygenase subunit alpha [Caldimonas sp.]